MYTQIVVGTDGTKTATVAVDAAIDLARLVGAILHVVHAHKVLSGAHAAAGAEMGIVPLDIMAANEDIHNQGMQICEQVVITAERVGVHAEAHCVAGDAADAVIRVAADVHADLIVVGNRGMTGMRRFVLGSVPNKVAHHCPTSILIVDTHQARA
jgi:nucleotide-binding universal stress UspA family protein